MKIRLIRIILIVFAITPVFLSTSIAQNTTSLGATQDISELLIGFNRRSDVGHWWSDESFIDLMEQMNPDIVRYPGGTQANYWDWRTGKFLDNTDKPWGNKEVLHIPEFVSALPERTKIVYVVNMARPTPFTGVDVNADEETLKSYATLELKIEDMIAAITEFVDEGKEPYAVELGNEFYFGNIESGIFEIIEDDGVFYSAWDYDGGVPYISTSKNIATILNARFYLDHCKQIVESIKNNFPNIKIILVTTKSGNGNSARDKWNETIFDELENNPDYANLKNNIYAVTQHHYINDTYGSPTLINDNQTAKIAIAEGISYPIEKQADYDMVPDDYKIWYTEYGATKRNAEKTWTTGLRYAALAVSWLNRGNKVGQLGFHHITNPNVVKVDTPMILAPIGIAASLLAQASADATEMQKISFSNNPISVNGIKSLYGYKFKDDHKESIFIINISDQDFSEIQTNHLFTYTGQAHLTQYYSDEPYITPVFDGHSNIIPVSSEGYNNLDSPNFSISVIEVKNQSAINDNELMGSLISIFPNPFNEKITINNINTYYNDVSIYNFLGERIDDIHKKMFENEIEIETTNLPKGIYLIQINDYTFTVYKQ